MHELHEDWGPDKDSRRASIKAIRIYLPTQKKSIKKYPKKLEYQQQQKKSRPSPTSVSCLLKKLKYQGSPIEGDGISDVNNMFLGF